VERLLTGDAPVRLADEVRIIPVPGHRRGHVCGLYRDQFLFTGDPLAWEEEAGVLTACRDYCWFSWPEQIRSMEKLVGLRFTWVLPGHGRRYQAPSPAMMQQQLRACLAWMYAA
jgi:glyoxylase-like metal-dependent hydrolase (beta-lactamase superfamily II)